MVKNEIIDYEQNKENIEHWVTTWYIEIYSEA